MNLKRSKRTLKQKSKEELKAIVDEMVVRLDDHKAVDIQVLDVSDKTDVCYYMVLASGTSNRHVSAAADKIVQFVKHEVEGVDHRIEGANEGYWVLIDCYDIVVHLFQKEAREYYDIEKVWESMKVAEE